MKVLHVIKATKGSTQYYVFSSSAARLLKDRGFKIKLVKLDAKTREEV